MNESETRAEHHSDRGVQYASIAYRKILKALKLIQNMSRKGNCYFITPTPSRPSISPDTDDSCTLAKVNYHIHTDAIQQNLIPETLTKQQMNFVYASEADLLNVALFGMTSKEWRDQNPDLRGNLRD